MPICTWQLLAFSSLCFHSFRLIVMTENGARRHISTMQLFVTQHLWTWWGNSLMHKVSNPNYIKQLAKLHEFTTFLPNIITSKLSIMWQKEHEQNWFMPLFMTYCFTEIYYLFNNLKVINSVADKYICCSWCRNHLFEKGKWFRSQKYLWKNRTDSSSGPSGQISVCW